MTLATYEKIFENQMLWLISPTLKLLSVRMLFSYSGLEKLIEIQNAEQIYYSKYVYIKGICYKRPASLRGEFIFHLKVIKIIIALESLHKLYPLCSHFTPPVSPT